MSTAFRRCVVVLAIACFTTGYAFSQSSTPESQFGFKMELGVGVQSFGDLDSSGNPIQYQDLAFTPEVSFGPFGIGFALQLDYTFSGTDNSFQIRQADWVPSTITFQTLAALYLPKIMYVRWGEPSDPLYVKFGSFNDGTLGDGFIMGSYDNTLFLPASRHFGLQANLDGSLFQFPFVGVQSVIGNLAALDVLGGRAYVRPLVATSIPILKDIAFGVTGVVDTNPYLGTTSTGTPAPISVLGADIQQPLLYVKDLVTLVAFTDVATIQSTSWGGMIGFGGNLIDIFTYGAQLRFLGANFIPDYFGPTYDLLRDQQYNTITSGVASSPAMVGWEASLGTTFLDNKIIFNVSLDGPFASAPADLTPDQALLYYPHLRGILSLAEGVVPGITFDFSYDKKAIASFSDLISAQNAAIQAQVNFQSGPAVISFVYKIVYDPTQPSNPWTVTSGLQSSISLF